MSHQSYWAKFPPLKPDGITVIFDDGLDGLMPKGWYLLGTKGGFCVRGQEYGPYRSKEQALADLSEEYKSLPIREQEPQLHPRMPKY